MTQEQLLGFDLRLPAEQSGFLWDAARRERFLLQTYVGAPLSVDVLVWPSAFDYGQGIGLPASERERLHLAGIPTPAYTGPNACLWEDMAGLLAYSKECSSGVPACDLIAISWWSGQNFTEAGRYGPFPADPKPTTIDPTWERLGFDVADGSLTSGLSNCGYLAEEAIMLRSRWAPSLNKHHLFDQPTSAFQFREISDQRVSEHAPFCVYCLYRVKFPG